MADGRSRRRPPSCRRRRRPALDRVVAKAFDGQTYRGSTWGVVVIKDGKIVAERYEGGFNPHMPARTNSMCKSLAATVVGVGVKKGLVDIHKKAPLAEWRRPGDPRGQITINDMLHMASGLYTEAAGDPQPELYTGGAAAAERSALNTIDSRAGRPLRVRRVGHHSLGARGPAGGERRQPFLGVSVRGDSLEDRHDAHVSRRPTGTATS